VGWPCSGSVSKLTAVLRYNHKQQCKQETVKAKYTYLAECVLSRMRQKKLIQEFKTIFSTTMSSSFYSPIFRSKVRPVV